MSQARIREGIPTPRPTPREISSELERPPGFEGPVEMGAEGTVDDGFGGVVGVGDLSQ